jgi:hypothetical protein
MGPRAFQERCRKSGLPPAFDPQTMKPIASRYADRAIEARAVNIKRCFNKPHPVKAHGVMEAYLHSFLISVQVEVFSFTHRTL